MNHLDLFSGIGGFTKASENLFHTVAFCEIDKYCHKVLRHHYPQIPVHEDIRSFNGRQFDGVDIITGGFPCQDVSIAGNRNGLDGHRSGLWFDFARVIDHARPRWVVIENVPGLLTSNRGRDFYTILNQMVEFGYGVAWRVLDAQFFGVPQRRKRVFIVGSFGDMGSGKVLFDGEGGRGYNKKSQEPEEGYPKVIGTIPASGAGTSRPAGQGNELDFLIPIAFGGGNQSGDIKVATTLSSKNQRLDWETETFIVDAWDCRNHRTQGGVSGTLQSKGTSGYSLNYINPIYSNLGVRRLTPLECERLQGFPDGYTDIDLSDTRRYSLLGNSIAVPVVKQLMERIYKYEGDNLR